ncbi:COQ9 family protein [Palleronia sp.]|uniref:COQ9 family protein n=1 Tax=Palleronia sp. TaxID=1940284 RepID=UPI0035C7B9D1
MDDPQTKILDAALAHVPFDGWSEQTLKRAASDAGVPLAQARGLFPRGAVDLALAFHRRGDAEMARRVREEDMAELTYSGRVARAIWLRLASVDKEAARRAATLFALPIHTADGARAVWGTADAIWSALGDASTDGNWYTKRATLSGVYASAVLFWLGDDSVDHQETKAFIARRIDDVMRIEKMKSALNSNPLGRAVMTGPNFVLSRLRAPIHRPKGFPGSVADRH